MINPIFDVGQKVYFTNLKYQISNNSLTQQIISDFFVQKIIVEKLNGSYIYSYVLNDSTDMSMIKKESDIFATEAECQAYISSVIGNAITCLQSSLP